MFVLERVESLFEREPHGLQQELGILIGLVAIDIFEDWEAFPSRTIYNGAAVPRVCGTDILPTSAFLYKASVVSIIGLRRRVMDGREVVVGIRLGLARRVR